MKKKYEVTKSSGNVFADLGLPNPEELALKSGLVSAICARVADMNFSRQADVGKRLGISQPKVSKLLRGHFHEYSVERLLGFLSRLNMDIEISYKPTRANKPGHVHIHAA